MNSKKACCTLLLIFFSTLLRAQDFDILGELTENSEFLEEATPTTTRRVNPADIVSPLILIGVDKLLQEDLFCHTNQLNTRNIVDISIFLPQKVDTYRCPTVTGVHLFLNKTNRMNFTRNSSSICSYLSLFGPNVLEKIQDSVAKIKEFIPSFNIDPVNILPLFQNFTIEERKAGFMLHAEHYFGRYNFRALIPLYYVERNFFASEADQQAIKKELGTLGKETEMEFAEQHFIADKFGLGDIRLTFDTALIGSPETERDCWGVRLGALTTLPTAVAFTKGIKGSHFPKNSCRPTFSFEQLFEKQNITATTAVLQDFILKVIDHMSANLIEPELGNGGHVGIGGLMKSVTPLKIFVKRPWAERIYFKSFLSLEYLCPAYEKRFFIEDNIRAAFDEVGLNKTLAAVLNKIAEDPAYAKTVLTFLEEQFVDTLFPFVFSTKVNPGFVFRWNTRAFYEGTCWGFNIGSDLWVQGKETLSNVKRCGESPERINIAKAIKPVAYQSKIMGALFYTLKCSCVDWTFGLNMDNTIINSGIGADYSVSLNVEANF